MGGPKHRVSNRIRELRFHRGEMTQQELADRVGVTRQTVNAIEGAKYSPSLEVPLDEVFRYRPRPASLVE